MFDEKLFEEAVRLTVQQWPSFQLSVSNGMGGSLTQSKLEWMYSVIVELFRNNENLLIDDVADYVAEIIDNEFDTIIEDGSLEMVCSSIIAYYNHLCAGEVQYVTDKLSIIKQKQAQQLQAESQSCSNPAQNMPTEHSDSTSANVSVAFNSKQQETGSTNNENEMDTTPTTTDDDNGWTVVKRKR